MILDRSLWQSLIFYMYIFGELKEVLVFSKYWTYSKISKWMEHETHKIQYIQQNPLNKTRKWKLNVIK